MRLALYGRFGDAYTDAGIAQVQQQIATYQAQIATYRKALEAAKSLPFLTGNAQAASLQAMIDQAQGYVSSLTGTLTGLQKQAATAAPTVDANGYPIGATDLNLPAGYKAPATTTDMVESLVAPAVGGAAVGAALGYFLGGHKPATAFVGAVLGLVAGSLVAQLFK